ncbi:hypothetical protein SteCoe_10866 [Stentor coeruleus]|uniref:WWE domain-containing protein n=1 Tax=Stentor coeruleus TaxID=5963 RepID=A0A1R2CES3_9CILI|nr:hypothetical protein SteCoe_10866 [Stentor coeruleus]
MDFFKCISCDVIANTKCSICHRRYFCKPCSKNHRAFNHNIGIECTFIDIDDKDLEDLIQMLQKNIKITEDDFKAHGKEILFKLSIIIRQYNNLIAYSKSRLCNLLKGNENLLKGKNSSHPALKKHKDDLTNELIHFLDQANNLISYSKNQLGSTLNKYKKLQEDLKSKKQKLKLAEERIAKDKLNVSIEIKPTMMTQMPMPMPWQINNKSTMMTSIPSPPPYNPYKSSINQQSIREISPEIRLSLPSFKFVEIPSFCEDMQSSFSIKYLKSQTEETSSPMWHAINFKGDKIYFSEAMSNIIEMAFKAHKESIDINHDFMSFTIEFGSPFSVLYNNQILAPVRRSDLHLSFKYGNNEITWYMIDEENNWIKHTVESSRLLEKAYKLNIKRAIVEDTKLNLYFVDLSEPSGKYCQYSMGYTKKMLVRRGK